jgi:ATP synthase F1 complex assembly factor 2
VLLDGRTLRTPQRKQLLLPTEALALAVAAEWDAQTDSLRGIQPAAMPLMTLASTAIDMVAADPAYVRKHALSYLATDTALFLSDDDRSLLALQKNRHGPVTRWAQQALGLSLRYSHSVRGRIEHDADTVSRVRAVIYALDDYSLTALQCATMESKSVLVGLALLFRAVSVEEAVLASRVEEEHQIAQWGAVEGGHDLDRLNNCVALAGADAFMRLLLSSERHALQASRWSQGGGRG